jgi:hypothetical protein
MTKDDIIKLAREAGFADGVAEIVGLEGFANYFADNKKAREAALEQQQAEPVAWMPVAEALPKTGVKVLACYRNRLGNLRRIRAMWTAAKTEEADSDAEACYEYDEAADTYYVTEGWYECIDNWDNFSSVAVTEGEVTHWMPLPQPPIEAAHGIKEGA